MHKGEKMKKVIFVLIIVLSLFLFFKSTYAQLNDVQKQEMVFKNFFVNGGFENGKAKWSVSGGTFTLVTSGSNLGFGKGSASFDASAANQFVESALVQIPNAIAGNNCEASIKYKGGDNNLIMQIIDNSSNIVASQQLYASTNYTTAYTTFICPTSGSLKLRIASTADAAVVYLDDAYIGENTKAFNYSTAQIVGTLKYPPAANCVWQTTLGSFADFSQDTDCATPIVTGKAIAPSTKVPHVLFNNLQKGSYKVIYRTRYLHNVSSDPNSSCRYRILKNSDVIAEGVSNGYFQSSLLVGEFKLNSTENVELKIQSQLTSGSGVCNIFAATGETETGLDISLYKIPDDSEIAINSSENPFFVNAEFSGGSWTTQPSSLTVPNASNWSITNKGIVNAKITCTGGNPATGTTCATGNEQFGIAFNVPKTGHYEVCFSFIRNWGDTSNCGEDDYYIYETQNNSDTMIQSSKYFRNASCIDYQYNTVNYCHDFYINSVGEKTFKIFHFTAGNPYNNWYNITPSAITVKQVTSASQVPILLGSVTSNDKNKAYRVESLKASGGTIISQTGNWIASVTGSSGDYFFNFVSGIFKSTPYCVCNAQYMPGIQICQSFPSATNVRVQTRDISNVLNDNDINLICMGERGN